MIGLHLVVVMVTPSVSYSAYGLPMNVTYYKYANDGDYDVSKQSNKTQDELQVINLNNLTRASIVKFFTNTRISNKLTNTRTMLEYTAIDSDMLTSVRGCGKDSFLVIIVCSTVNHFHHRDVIRRTWASNIPASVKIFFLVGLSNNENTSYLLDSESSNHDDLLQVNIRDSYDSLTNKSIAMLQWLTRSCLNIAYLLKVDDDTLVNVPRLLDSLHHVTISHFIMGNIIAGAQPMRDRSSKWYTPIGVYSEPTYPDYVSGSAYVISGDLIQDLYTTTQRVPFFWVEDIYITGLCPAKLNATLVHNYKFKSLANLNNDSCMITRYLTMHRVDHHNVLQIWKRHRQRKRSCV